MAKITNEVSRGLTSADGFTHYFNMLYDKVSNMFVWEKLPKSIDINYLNRCLFLKGHCAIFKKDNNFYVACGAFSGTPNEYYQPTEYVIANPVLGSHNLKIGKDCVIFYNSAKDIQYNDFPIMTVNNGGLYSLIYRTAILLSDNETSINVAQKNSRFFAFATADTENAYKSTAEVFKKIYNGEGFSIAKSDIASTINISPLATGGGSVSPTLQTLIDIQQYFLAQFYHAIGINSNFNMKKERLVSDEIAINDTATEINIKSMLEMRKNNVVAFNALFDNACDVSLSEEWKRKINESEVNKPCGDMVNEN